MIGKIKFINAFSMNYFVSKFLLAIDIKRVA